MRPLAPFVLLLTLLAGCSSDDRAVGGPAFDVPALVRQPATQIRETLGEPTIEFQPTASQRTVGTLATIEYTRGTTTLSISYSPDNVVREAFLSDVTAGRTAGELYALGNLEEVGPGYTATVRPWATPEFTQSRGGAQVAGLTVTPE